jgi:TRAP-type C4-dicarboxylate transport system permease large subunit
MYVVGSYAAYLTISISLTVWVARTLMKNGRVFLIDTFLGNETLADSVNQLLGVGFYLINAGYVTLALKYGTRPVNLAEAIETLSTKVGLVLLVLGVMHFFNLYVFSKLRRRAMLKSLKPPVLPEQFIEPVQSWNH